MMMVEGPSAGFEVKQKKHRHLGMLCYSLLSRPLYCSSISWALQLFDCVCGGRSGAPVIIFLLSSAACAF